MVRPAFELGVGRQELCGTVCHDTRSRSDLANIECRDLPEVPCEVAITSKLASGHS